MVATLTVSALGTAIGIVSGYVQGRADRALVALLDVMLALPWLLVLLVLVSGWGSGPVVLVVAVVLTGAPFVARVARAATLQVVHAVYVEPARALGERCTRYSRARSCRTSLRRCSPMRACASSPRCTSWRRRASSGFGLQPPATDWGLMIAENVDGMELTPWAVVVPAVLIASLAVSVNLLVDRLANRLAR